MSRFIEVHEYEDGTIHLLNINYIQEIVPHNDNSVIFFGYTPPDGYQQDMLATIESYGDIRRLIDEAVK